MMCMLCAWWPRNPVAIEAQWHTQICHVGARAQGASSRGSRLKR